jgi:hypothetical protein
LVTPRVMALVFAGAGERLKQEQQGRAWQAWHTAALPRLKTFPTLESLMGIKRQAQRQTASEMEAIFKAWAARG